MKKRVHTKLIIGLFSACFIIGLFSLANYVLDATSNAGTTGYNTLQVQDITICAPNTYYIDYDGGNDANNGACTTSAWKHSPGDSAATGNAATAVPHAGNTIRFKGGVAYHGVIGLSWSGSAGNPLVYNGNSDGLWGTGRAILDGQGNSLSINASQFGFYFLSFSGSGPSHIIINNFEIRNLRNVYPDDFWDQPAAVFIWGTGEDIEIKNLYIHDIKKKTVPVATESGMLNVTYFSLTDSGRDFSHYLGVRGNLATHSVKLSWLINGWKSDYYQANGYVGEENTSSHSINVYKDIYLTQPGWNYYSDFPPVNENNSGYFYFIYNLSDGPYRGSGGQGIGITGYSNLKIHNNTIRENRNAIGFSPWIGNATNIEISNNDICDVSWAMTITPGDINQSINNLSIFGNKLHDFNWYVENDWGWNNDGIFFFSTLPSNPGVINNLKLYNNFFYGEIGGATALLYMTDSVRNAFIFNNLFASSAGAGYMVRTIGSRTGPPMTNINFFNNAFARIPGERKYSTIFQFISNISFRNNIFYLTEQGGSIGIDTTASEGFSSDYNLLYGIQWWGADVAYNGSTYSSAQWPNASYSFPHDQHSVILKNPKFVSFPSFATNVNRSGNTTRIYYQNYLFNTAYYPNNYYPNQFQVGDNIEYNYDKLIHTVVGVTDDYIDVNPPLLKQSTIDEYIINWKNISSVTYDLSLKNDSPLIGAGTDLSEYCSQVPELCKDYDGNPRPQDSPWDIGAYEYTNETARPMNARCGASNNNCIVGTLNDIVDNSTSYLWQCLGSGGGTSVSCSLIIPSSPGNPSNPGSTDGGGADSAVTNATTNKSSGTVATGGIGQAGQTTDQQTEAAGSNTTLSRAAQFISSVKNYLIIFAIVLILAIAIVWVVMARKTRTEKLRSEMFEQVAANPSSDMTNFNDSTNQEPME